MLFINDLKQNPEKYDLPERFVDILPSECPDCGSPLEMSETLTGLHCSNPRCVSKIVMRIRAICLSLNIVDFGETTIRRFVDYYGITNPLNFFDLKPGMQLADTVSDKVSEKVIAQLMNRKDFLLWEFVQVANLPYIQTSARKIFQGYDSLEEAYDDIEDGGVDFIKTKLGIKGSDDGVSIQAVKIYTTLMEYKEDLLEGVQCVNIISLTENNIKELNVVCSDQVGCGYKTKPVFYAYIKEHFGDKVHVNFLTSVNHDIDYLVWAGADGSEARYTSKVQKVEGYNAKGYNIPIVNANMFIAELEKL